MDKTTVILTEKKNVSKMIAKALAPETFDDRDNCSCEHKDIISIKEKNQKVPCYANKKRFHYFCKAGMNCDACKFSGQHTDDQGMKSSGSIRKKLQHQNKGRRKERRREIIFEDISYYLIQKKGEQILIIDTHGTPYSLDFPHGKGKNLEALILKSKNWKDLEQKINHSPEWSYHSKSSHRARSTLFDCIFVKQKLPTNGKEIKIDKIIAATDYDVAGSYIVESVIASAKENGAKIDIDKIFRMKLQDSNPETVLEEYRDLKPFDWGNAYAGKLRSLFDFLYGVTLTNSLNHFKSKKYDVEDGDKVWFSVGRTKFLGLGDIIRKENSLVAEKSKKYVYLIFEGLLDKRGVETALVENNYSTINVEQKKSRVSLASVMKSLADQHVGTHTTRHKLFDSLSELELISLSEDGRRVSSTEYGKYFYERLRPLIDNSKSGFSLSVWNQLIYAMMKGLSKRQLFDESLVSEQKKALAEKDLDQIMNKILTNLKPHFRTLKREYRGLVKDLVKSYIELKPEKSSKGKTENYEPKQDKVISREEVAQFIDMDTNQILPETGYVFEREIKQDFKRDTEQALRNICSVGSEYSLEFLDHYNLGKILAAEDDDFTVFRAEFSGETGGFEDVKIKKYNKIEKEDDEKEEKAHEPLIITDLKFSNIKGPKGRLLIREYNRPWERTFNKMENEDSRRVNLKSFKNGGLVFERVEDCKYGKVHNFESLLIAMLEKYGIPFGETAEMAEEVYLNN